MNAISKTCGHCGQPVPLWLKVGDKCPQCRVAFGYERTSTTLIRAGTDWKLFGKILLVAFAVSALLGVLLIRMGRERAAQAPEALVPPPAPTATVPEEVIVDTSARVKMADGTEINVMNIRLKETAVGLWMGATPSRHSTELYYVVDKAGVQLHRSIPFGRISRIELHGAVAGFTLLLRDGGRILCDLRKHTITVTDAGGVSEELKCSSTCVRDVIQSGERVENQAYTPDGFVGEAIIDGEHGNWTGDFDAIQSIDFAQS